VFFDSIKILSVGFRTRGDTGVVDSADSLGFRLVVLDNRRVAADMVCVVMRGDKMVNASDLVALEIFKHVLPIVSIIACIDEHRFSIWTDNERAH
jgi:hypothetical protein